MQFQACAYCDHPNPVGTNYCNDCGAALHLKPCRSCGAVAVAMARHCPACKVEFPARPTINVDIPWAVPNAPRLSGVPVRKALPGVAPSAAESGMESDAEQLSATTQAVAATRRLIEKASTRPMLQDMATELVLPPPRREELRGNAGHGSYDPDSSPIYGPIVVDVIDSARSLEAAAAGPIRQAEHLGEPSGRYGPIVFITLLGLVAAVALIYLVRYAGEDSTGTSREIASPYKLLLRPAATPVPVDSDTTPAASRITTPAPMPAAIAADTPVTSTAAPTAGPARASSGRTIAADVSRPKAEPIAGTTTPDPTPSKTAKPAARSAADGATRARTGSSANEAATPTAFGAVDADPYSAAMAPALDPAPIVAPAPAVAPARTVAPAPITVAVPTATAAATALAPAATTTPATTAASCSPELQALDLCDKLRH